MTVTATVKAPTVDEMRQTVVKADMMARIDTLEGTVANLRERLARYEERGYYMTAEEMYERAERWIALNAQAWAYIKREALACVRRNERFSMKRAAENLRYKSGIVMSDEDYKVCNSYTAALSRFLLREMPELRGHMFLRRSKVDKFFPDVQIRQDTD